LSKYILDYAVNLLCTQKNIKEFSIFEIEDIPPLIFEKIDIIVQSDNGEEEQSDNGEEEQSDNGE
jgi:hypothetical protein